MNEYRIHSRVCDCNFEISKLFLIDFYWCTWIELIYDIVLVINILEYYEMFNHCVLVVNIFYTLIFKNGPLLTNKGSDFCM